MASTPTLKSLEQLQAENLPRCDWRSFLKIEGGELSADEVAALDAHFAHFLPPGMCCKCGAQQGASDVMQAFLGIAKFTWGIQHGEGFCSTKGCGWPARALHYDIGPIKRLELILQYHPAECSPREPVESEPLTRRQRQGLDPV